jgi:AraC family ethanolamine operon transcriptional activator
MFGRRLQGGQFEYMPLPGHPFRAAMRALRIGDAAVQHVEVGACLNRGALAPGMAALILPLRMEGAPTVANGMQLGQEDAVLLPGGTELMAAGAGSRHWIGLALPERDFAGIVPLAPHRPGVERPLGVLRLRPDLHARLCEALLAVAATAANGMDAAAGVAGQLGLALRELTEEALSPEPAQRTPGRAVREAVRVLRQSEEYLHANLARPIHRDELCVALGVSRRKLHDAFVATVGMSPPTYLKLRRLVLARRALRAGRGRETLVKSIALSHGFWHLGHFAKDYKEMFGESPSRTAAWSQTA